MRVNQAVERVTATGRCTRAQVGMDTWGGGGGAGRGVRSELRVRKQAVAEELTAMHTRERSTPLPQDPKRPLHPALSQRTSGVYTVRGTRVQKKPSDTKWVEHLRTPKYSSTSSSLRYSGSCRQGRAGEGEQAGVTHGCRRACLLQQHRLRIADARTSRELHHCPTSSHLGAPDVGAGLAPQLDGAARPAVLLLAVRKEGGGQLRGGSTGNGNSWSRG